MNPKETLDNTSPLTGEPSPPSSEPSPLLDEPNSPCAEPNPQPEELDAQTQPSPPQTEELTSPAENPLPPPTALAAPTESTTPPSPQPEARSVERRPPAAQPILRPLEDRPRTTRPGPHSVALDVRSMVARSQPQSPWTLRRKLLLSFLGVGLSLATLISLAVYLTTSRALQFQSGAQTQLTYSGLTWVTLLSFLGAIVACTLVALALAKHLGRPMAALLQTIQRIIQGDDSARAPIWSGDELGRLAMEFNRLVETRLSAQQNAQDENQRLQDGIYSLLYVAGDASNGDLTVRAPVTEGVLGNVADAVNLMLQNMGSLVEEVHQAAARVSYAALEIQESSEKLEEGAVQQASQIIDTTLALQDIAAQIEAVSTNAEAAAHSAARTRLSAEEGSEAVAQVIHGMDRLRQSVQAGARKIKRLGDRSTEISSIVSTIGQISAQTDILALNAAIEAARAGEHGRGFTVVAEEVRKLAERAAAATKEIEVLVAGIQTETHESVAAMEEQTLQVEAESQVVSSAGAHLSRIHEFSMESSQLIGEINQAAKAQVQSANDVVQAMHSVQRIAQEAQAGTVQSKLASESLTALSSDLLFKIGKFKIESDSVHPNTSYNAEAAA